MGETTLLYALSTVAQSCAALVAFLGALVLFRLQSLAARREDFFRNVRGLIAKTGKAEWKPELVALLPSKEIRHIAKTIIDTPETDAQREVQEPIQEEYTRLEGLGRDQRRTERLLILFGGLNLAIVLVALIGFDFVWLLRGCWWSSLGLWGAGVAIFISTMGMIFELTGSLAQKLDRIKLGRFRKWLEREYLEPGQPSRNGRS